MQTAQCASIGKLQMPIGDAGLLHDLDVDTLSCTSRLHRTYGDIVSFPKGELSTVFTRGVEAGYAVFSDPETYHVFGHPGSKNTAQRRFGQGLFGINGSKQRQHRRLLMPAVRKEVVEASASAMESLASGFVNEWQAGEQIDLYASMKELSLRVAGRLLFGLEDLTTARKVAIAFQDWLDNYITAVFAISLPLELSRDRYQLWLEAGSRMEGYLKEMIAERRATLGNGRLDLLALLLRAQDSRQISEADVIGEMHSLFNASYQTTASAMTWTLLLLIQHPHILTQLNREWDDSTSSLLSRVIRESMRVLPPVVFVMRILARDGHIAGHDLRSGTILFHNLFMTHHKAELFPDPETFDPDRWLHEHPSPFAYAPFAAGPRMCLGTAFSLQLFQLAVPAILKRFRLVIPSGTTVNQHSSLTMGIRGALPVNLHDQDGRFSATPISGNVHEMVDLPFRAGTRQAA